MASVGTVASLNTKVEAAEQFDPNPTGVYASGVKFMGIRQYVIKCISEPVGGFLVNEQPNVIALKNNPDYASVESKVFLLSTAVKDSIQEEVLLQTQLRSKFDKGVLHREQTLELNHRPFFIRLSKHRFISEWLASKSAVDAALATYKKPTIASEGPDLIPPTVDLVKNFTGRIDTSYKTINSLSPFVSAVMTAHIEPLETIKLNLYIVTDQWDPRVWTVSGSVGAEFEIPAPPPLPPGSVKVAGKLTSPPPVTPPATPTYVAIPLDDYQLNWNFEIWYRDFYFNMPTGEDEKWHKDDAETKVIQAIESYPQDQHKWKKA